MTNSSNFSDNSIFNPYFLSTDSFCMRYQGNISCKDGHNKGQKDIKKRWQEYTEELYKKDLHDPDTHDGVITHLEPYILECKVKWALGTS